jgi:crotonobetainyl-CoA:carnitine CoA-transferase CaiB-like acyl-CoA transferase
VKDREAVSLARDLQQVGVMACHVVKAYDLASDPGLEHSGFFQELERPPIGRHHYRTWPFRFSSMPLAHRAAAPLLGEHNGDILKTGLGLTSGEVRDLEEAGVIGSRPSSLAKQNY